MHRTTYGMSQSFFSAAHGCFLSLLHSPRHQILPSEWSFLNWTWGALLQNLSVNNSKWNKSLKASWGQTRSPQSFCLTLKGLIKMHSSDCELTLYTKCFLYNWSIWFNGSLWSLSFFYAESHLEWRRITAGQRSVSAGHKSSFYLSQ